MTDLSQHDTIRALRWLGDALELLDQRKLPLEETWLRCTQAAEVADAIHALVVRGAPAIGIAAAYGVVLAARERVAQGATLSVDALAEDFERLRQSGRTPNSGVRVKR